MIFSEYKDKTTLMAGLADRVAQELAALIDANGATRLTVPGGSTPGPMFDQLCKADIDWAKVHVMLSDERWVPLDSDRSNTGLIKSRLLQGKAAAAQYVPLYNGSDTAQMGAAEIAASVEDHLPLGVVVLGMGNDMHTASLFPGAKELALGQSDDAPAALAVRPGHGLEDRITLSARALLTATHIHVLIVGNEKKTSLETAKETAIDKAPIAQFLPNAHVHWAES